MADKVELSSSEQYVKKSNRWLLVIAIVALLAFLFGLLMLTSGSRRAVDEETPVVINEEHAALSANPNVFDFNDNMMGRNAGLSAYPDSVSMTGVVLGSSAEAIVTLTAKGGPIRIESMNLAQEQQDGFIISPSEGCGVGSTINAEESCNIQVLWNPVSIRSYSNYLTIRWRLDNPNAMPVPEQKSLKVNITGQSTDSKDCVICETKGPDQAAARLGTLGENGIYSKDGEIMGVIELDKIAISNSGSLLGRVTKDTKEVVDTDGKVLGRVLGDGTVVTRELEVLGGALPLASVLDASGKVIGQLTAEGTVVNKSNELIGLPMADGTVVDTKNNKIIGSIMPWGVVLNLSSKAVGATQLDGTVVSLKGQSIGRVLPGGLVVNDSGVIVGGVVSAGLGVGDACHFLGKVAGNGKIYNAFDQQVAYTSLDGLVLDMSGVPVGRVIQEGVVINLKGEVTAFVNSEGKAVAADANLIGCVNPDTSVSSGNKAIGAVMSRGRVVGYDTEVKGLVLPNGSVVTPLGEAIGSVMPSGYVVDMEEKTLGAVVPKGTAVAPGCVFLGILDLNGQVFDSKGIAIGAINPDKKVLNRAREVIGGVTPMGAVADFNGKFVGYVLPNGKVIDRTGQIVGCVNPDGTVVDEKGKIFALVTDAGVILDANGNPTDLTGNVIDGKLVNANGEIIGFVPPDGIVVSPTGEFLGRFIRKVGYAVDSSGKTFARILPDYTAVSVENSDILGALIPDGAQIIDLKNNVIGSVQGNGAVMDSNSKDLGSVRADGTVLGSDGILIGAVMPTGNALDWNGNVIGAIQSDGRVINQSQKEVGRVALNRTVFDANDRVIGMAFPEPSIPLGDRGEVIGSLTITGGINRNGKPYGHITPAGNVFANNGEQIGSLVRLGSVMGNDGEIKGWVSFDGKFNSKENFAAIGQIMPNGEAINDAGVQIGHVIPRSTVIDLKGNFAGIVAVNGRLLGKSGNSLGAFAYDDRLMSDKNVWLGRSLKPGVAVDNSGRLLGYTRYDGRVANSNSQVMGIVRFDNRVVNSSNEVIGQYVPYGQSFFDQRGKVLGAMAFDGIVRDGKGSEVGYLVGTTLVNKNNEALGNAFTSGFAINEQGRVSGYIFPDAKAFADVDGMEESYNLTTSQRLVDRNKQIVGSSVPFGVPLGLDLSNIGNLIGDGFVLRGMELSGRTLGDSILYDNLNKVLGGVTAPSVMVGRDGRIVGTTSVSSLVNDFTDKKIGLLLPFGTSLNSQNVLVGMTMPMGVAVNDRANIVGFVAPDGSVVKADGAMAGRVMQDGTIVRLLSRDIYGVMPDFADVVASGVAIGLKPELVGRAMPSGDVLDTANKKIASIIDNGMLLGQEGLPVGALVAWRTAINHNTVVLGNTTGDGYVTSVSGEKIGHLASNGAVKGNHQLKTLGAIIPKELVAKQCRVQGQVRYDGRIIDGNGKVVGSIGVDGAAKDWNGNSLGAVVKKGTVIADGEKGEVLGRTLPDADVVNKAGVSIGCALEDGTVINKEGKVIGSVLKRGLVVDENGNVIGYVLRDAQVVDGNGNVIGHTLSDGSVVDGSGKLIGHVVDIKDRELLHDDKGKIIGSMSKGGEVYDNNNRHLFTVSPDDKIYDPNGNLIGTIDKNGNMYDLAGNKIGTATDLPHYMYDSNGNITGYIKDGKLFDTHGNQTGWMDENGNIYDMNGTLIGKVNPDGSVTWFNEQEACSNAKYNGEVHSARGELIYNIKCGKIYDKNGNLIGYIDENGNMFDLNGSYIGHVDANGNVYDANGTLIGTWTPEAFLSEACLNAKYNGEVRDARGALIYTIKCGKVYDKNGNLIGTIDADGNMYDLNGNYMGHVDENGNVYDADGNLIGKWTAKDFLSSSCLNAKYNGEVRNPNGELLYTIKCGKIYDKNGNLIGTIDENGNMYDLNGNYMGRVDENGNVYDAAGNLIGSWTPDAFLSDGCINAKYNGEVRDSKGDLLYTIKCGKVYDKNGNLIGTIDANGNMYDLNGNYMERVDENGNVYDADGNLIGKWTAKDFSAAECVNAKYNGEIRDPNGELIYTIKCGKIYDKNGNVIGYIDENGKMWGLDGRYLGRIDDNGNVYDANDNLIGKWTSSDLSTAACVNAKYNGEIRDANGELLYTIKCGKIYDKNGNLIGYIDENGKMWGLDGRYLGHVDENGNVFDADGNLIGKWKSSDPRMASCTNAKYNGRVHDLNGNLLYTIKCGKIYDKNGNLIGFIDEEGNMYDLNGNYIGRIDENGNVFDADGNMLGRLYPDQAGGFISGSKNLLKGGAIGTYNPNAGSLAGHKIAIGDKNFYVTPDNMIMNDKNAIVGKLVNGVPYSLSGNLLADELGGNGSAYPNSSSGYPQEQLQFDPNQSAVMREMLARRRSEQRQGVGKNFAKIVPDGRTLARARQKKAKDFGSKKVSSWPVDMSRMILKDKAIPAVLVRSIDSRFPNVPASAIVERNVYAEDGRNIIIPAGSKLIGSIAGGAGTNHVAKLSVSWERLIRPDGGQFLISGAATGDAQGRGGVAAYLDEQWLAKYGKPLMLSTLTSAVSYITAVDEAVTTNQDNATTVQSARAQAAQDARENFIDNMEQIFQQMIEESSSTPPVVFVPSGTRMTVFPMEDLWLRSEDDDVEDYENEFGEDTKSSFAPKNGGRQDRPLTGKTGQSAPIDGSEEVVYVDPEEEEEYYDPGYTGDEDEEEIYVPKKKKEESSDEADKPKKSKEPDLEAAYRSRQGLDGKSSSGGMTAPLEERGTSNRSALNTLY